MKICVCIPTFNNPNTIESVVLSCLRATHLPVLVVDDGSRVYVRDLLASRECLEAFRTNRLHVIRHEENQGKGVALQRAFSWCTSAGYSHALTIDGDGQHFAENIHDLVRVARERPGHVVIGCRRMDASNSPGISRLGRFFSNTWIHLLTGKKTRDSQSGLRVYPLEAVSALELWTRRFDFEMEVLLKLLFSGVDCASVDVDVYYPSPSERVSHFHKIVDNVRIMRMNLMVVGGMLRFFFGRIFFRDGQLSTGRKE